jgi:hypothetical protein
MGAENEQKVRVDTDVGSECGDRKYYKGNDGNKTARKVFVTTCKGKVVPVI